MKKSLFNRLFFISVAVYFVQGAVAITAIADFILTKNAFEFTWIQIALLAALSTITWSVKPLYGFLTDLVPLFGFRRKSYLLLASLLTICGYFSLGLFGTGFLPIALSLVVLNIGLGFSDVIVDGLIVENSSKSEIGWYQSICWRAKAVGIFIGYLFAGLLLERAVFSSFLDGGFILNFLNNYLPNSFPIDPIILGVNIIDVRFTFLLTGLLPILSFVATFFIEEKKATKSLIKHSREEISMVYVFSSLIALALTIISLIFVSKIEGNIIPFLENDQLASLFVVFIWGLWTYFYVSHLVKIKVATKTLIYAAIFLFLWRFTPSFGAPWQNYYINELALSQEKFGLVATVTPIAWFIGGFLYVRFFDKLPLKKLLLWTVIIYSCLGLTQLLVATPHLATAIGLNPIIKYSAAIILYPAYFVANGFSAWNEVLIQNPILNFDAMLTFFLEIMFMISFLPLFKLIAFVTPKGVEATNFAILASVMNLGLAFGAIIGGVIYTFIEGEHSVGFINFTGLHLTVIIGTLTSFLCLTVINKIKV